MRRIAKRFAPSTLISIAALLAAAGVVLAVSFGVAYGGGGLSSADYRVYSNSEDVSPGEPPAGTQKAITQGCRRKNFHPVTGGYHVSPNLDVFYNGLNAAQTKWIVSVRNVTDTKQGATVFVYCEPN